jgi:anti-sigma factor RsiW
LNDYLDDGLESTVRARFDRHIEACPRCRIVTETTRKTVQLYKRYPPREVPSSLESRLMAAILKL